MFGKTKNYILNTANIEDTDYAKVGKQAMSAAYLAKAGVAAPNSIVLTTEAFDDFITAADLPGKITALLADVNPEDPQTATKASQAISALIEQASFPSLILNPLVQAYKSLSGFSDKYVEVQASWTLSPDLIPADISECVKANVKGEPALLYAIKQCWSCLFSSAAILQRLQADTQENLSMAVVIQKMVQAEISGKAFTHDPITNDPAIVIEAILGLDDHKAAEIIPDIYRVDPTDMRIQEKNIMSQEYMYLRKGRAKADEDPNMRVVISPEWRRRQKLPDQFVIGLAHITHKLTQHYHHPIELRWAYETGQLIIVKAQELHPAFQIEHDAQSELDKALHADTPVEIVPITPVLPPEGKFAMKQIDKSINIKSLAAEVENMVNHPEEFPVELEAEPIAAEEIALDIPVPAAVNERADIKAYKSELGLLTNVYLDISDMSTDKLANAARFDGVYLDGTYTVLRQRTLPETVAGNKQQFSSLVESYALEISTAAKVVEPRPLYYCFSDIGQQEREQLAVQAASNNGSERFLEIPDALAAEVLAIKRARSTYDAKNIKLIFPRVRTETELTELKKVLSSQGLRRTSVMQLFAEISVPSFLYELSEIESHALDGMLINFEKLAVNMTGRHKTSEKDYASVFNAVSHTIKQNADKKFTYIMRLPAQEELVSKVLSLNLSGLVFSELPAPQTLQTVKTLESNQLQPTPAKRGRKLKSL